jgi:hypothetical protein
LRADGEDSQNDAEDWGVFAGEGFRVGVEGGESSEEPWSVDVEVVGYGVFEKDADEELGDVAWGDAGDGGREGARAGSELFCSRVV